jgi:hypothetical protein
MAVALVATEPSCRQPPSLYRRAFETEDVGAGGHIDLFRLIGVRHIDLFR